MLQSEGDSPHGKSAPKWRQGSSEGARPAGVRKFHPVCTSGIPAVPPPHLPVCAECQRNKTFLNELTVLWELVRFSFSVALFSEVLKVVLVKFTLCGLFFTSRKIKPAWLVRRSRTSESRGRDLGYGAALWSLVPQQQQKLTVPRPARDACLSRRLSLNGGV